jgi:hypothetical protein
LYAPFLALGGVGIWPAFRANARSTAALVWWLLSYTLVYATTLPNARRVRLPVELPLLILGAFALLAAAHFVLRSRARKRDVP